MIELGLKTDFKLPYYFAMEKTEQDFLLHQAVCEKDANTIRRLIQEGANPTAPNDDGETPIDFALDQDQEDLFYLLVEAQRGLYPKPIGSQDFEGYYYKCLLEAKQGNFIIEQAYYLVKLSNGYLQKQNWVVAAKLLNCALAILDKNRQSPLFQTYLLGRLNQIEIRFMKSKGFHVSREKIDLIFNNRIWLKNIRSTYVRQYNQKVPIQKIITRLTNAYRELLGSLILECQKLLGKPPTRWACLAMGSMARGEMCPYSDIEFAFLIEKKTEENLDYFRILAQLIELRIINLGETKFPIFDKVFTEDSIHVSPTPGGFSMDSGGNTPLGKHNFYELIDTPNGLAEFQTIKWMDADIIVTNALSITCHIAGDKKLVDAYHHAKKEAMNENDEYFFFLGTPFRKKLAFKLLQDNLHEFKPNLSEEKEKVSAFGIKKELYRPIQSIISNLALICELESTSTFGVIEELLKKRILCCEGANNLTKALETILTLRFEAHIFYEKEQEFLLHIERDVPQDPHFLYLDKNHIQALHDIYRVLIPLHRCGEKFLKTQEIDLFATATFCDNEPWTKGRDFYNDYQLPKAQEAFQNAISLNPHDNEAQLRLGDIEEQMGNFEGALKRALTAIELARKKYGEEHVEVAQCYNNTGTIYMNLGDYNTALEFFIKSLTIRIKIKDEEHLGESYANIGAIYIALEDYKTALQMCQQSLYWELAVRNELNADVAICYVKLGRAYAGLDEDDLALKNYEKALEIQLQVLPKNAPDFGENYNNIGMVYLKRGNYHKALEYFHKDIEITSEILGENNPRVALTYNNIGSAHFHLRNYTKALEYFNRALNIQSQKLGYNHFDIANTTNGIGAAYLGLKEYDKALDFLQDSLGILLVNFQRSHPKIDVAIKNLLLCATQASPGKIKELDNVAGLCFQYLDLENLSENQYFFALMRLIHPEI